MEGNTYTRTLVDICRAKNKVHLTSISVPFLNLTFSNEESLDIGSGDVVIT